MREFLTAPAYRFEPTEDDFPEDQFEDFHWLFNEVRAAFEFLLDICIVLPKDRQNIAAQPEGVERAVDPTRAADHRRATDLRCAADPRRAAEPLRIGKSSTASGR